jgi:hypothetical protein
MNNAKDSKTTTLRITELQNTEYFRVYEIAFLLLCLHGRWLATKEPSSKLCRLWNFSSWLKENMSCIHQKEQSVNVVDVILFENVM